MNQRNDKIVTIRHPYFGTIYLHDCEFKDGYVIGDYHNTDTPTGEGFIKETMNFPVSCIVKDKV